MDYDPRIEAFWFMGGVDVPQNLVNWRNRFEWLRDRLHEPIDRPIQYIGIGVVLLVFLIYKISFI